MPRLTVLSEDLYLLFPERIITLTSLAWRARVDGYWLIRAGG